MSIISAGTTLTTGLIFESDLNGNLVIKTGATGVTALTVDASQNVSFAKAPVFPSATVLNGVTYTWPAADGAANTYLKTNGSGTLSWSQISGGAQDYIVQSYGIV